MGTIAFLGPSSSNFDNIQYETTFDGLRRHASLAGRQSKSTSNEDAMAVLMENHQEFIHVMKSRKTKLEEAYCNWRENDTKGFLDATWRMSDCAVTADVISILMEIVTVSHWIPALLSCIFPYVFLKAQMTGIISSTLSAALPVGVDLEAEQRLERCDLCFQELKKVSASLMSLTRRRGEVRRLAQELSLIRQDIFQMSSISTVAIP